MHFERIAKQIKSMVADVIAYKLSDPRIEFVTVTKVELAKDYKTCKVFVSVFGPPEKQRAALRGLSHASGHIQSLLASKLSIRQMPSISFEYDESIERSIRLCKLIDDAVNDRSSETPAQSESDSPE